MDIENIVRISTEADTSGLDKYQKSVKDSQKATQNLNKENDKIKDSTKKASGGFANMGASMMQLVANPMAQLAAAMGGIKVLIADSVAKADVQIKAEAKLLGAYKKLGNQLGLTKDQYTALAKESAAFASAKQGELGVGDEVQLGMQAQLVTMGIYGEELNKLTVLAIDMAAATGKPAEEAVKKLGVGMKDAAQLMGFAKENGVALNQEETKLFQNLLNNGKQAEASAMIYEKLGTAYSGTAETLNQSFGGQLNNLMNLIGDVQEELGRVVGVFGGPLVEGISKFVQTIISGFQSPEFKNIVAMLSGLGSAIAALGNKVLGDNVRKVIDTIKKTLGDMARMVTENVNRFFELIQTLAQSSTVFNYVIGFITNIIGALADFRTMIFEVAVGWLKFVSSLATFNPKEIEKAFNDMAGGVSKSFDDIKNKIAKVFNPSELAKEGKEAALAVVDGFKAGQAAAQKKLDFAAGIDPKTAYSDGEEMGDALAEGIKSKSGKVEESIETPVMKAAKKAQEYLSAIAPVFDMIGEIADAALTDPAKNTAAALQAVTDELNGLEDKYKELYAAIDEEEAALAEQRNSRNEEEEELKAANLQAELDRLNGRTSTYLTAAEKQKKKDLEKALQEKKLAEEQAAQDKKIEEDRLTLDKQMAAEKANLEFAQKNADWENQKATFEGEKQKNILASSLALAKAPMDLASGILAGLATGGPAGMIAAGIAGAASIVSIGVGAAQLASAAGAAFDVPKPVKAFASGGYADLTDGNQFLIGGRAGAEEMATVQGGKLYIENAVQTEAKNRQGGQSVGGDVFNIGVINISSNDPKMFAEGLKNLMREERYK